ncbi:hypothetical protein ACFPN1_08000 [Lysobacter yangpyeongensis]|uniref:Uncharacterized protein n=2 Tax=Lysobacter yangpyeongensis TaxID=346182 RepID=A0ABW0SN08_9GAMM
MPLLSDRGAYRTSVVSSRGLLRYSLMSILPGRPGELKCKTVEDRLGPTEGLHLLVQDCAGLASETLAEYVRSFGVAEVALRHYFDGMRVERLELILLSPGVQHLGISKGVGKRNALRLSMSFRAIDGDVNLVRDAIRSFAHEVAHLGFKSAGDRGLGDDEEYAAGVAESCVEYDTFGDTRGYVFPEDIAEPHTSSFDSRQRNSLLSSRRAYVDVAGFFDTGRALVLEDRSGNFRRFCAAQLIGKR